MSLYNTVSNFLNKGNSTKKIKLAKQPESKEAKRRVLPHVPKAITRTRQDITSFNSATALALSEEPKNYAIQLLQNETKADNLLTSQIENRKQQVFSRKYNIMTASGEIDEAQTLLLKSLPATRKIINAILDKEHHGYSVIELSLGSNVMTGQLTLDVDDIPRTNIVPQTGRFYKDYTEDKFILYRDMPEYGIYILEFDSKTLGLLSKAIPQVLFKRFAQSCWSELCEIYGIPPRVMKTNTNDPAQLRRAEQMMSDMGAAAWFIIDETEKFEWAEGVSTNGDVYRNLINLCNNELSLLISGAVIGQDTVNGNRSKDESAQNMLGYLVQSDVYEVEASFNSIVIPALIKLGILKGEVHLEFEPNEDIEQLWTMTKESMQYMTIDSAWVKKKFGVEVTGERTYNAPGAGDKKLQFEKDFFD